MWPQWVMFVLMVLGLGMAIGNHGQPQRNYSFWTSLIGNAITFAILYFGGFWKGMF
jgi:hypothetical protein